MSERLNYDHSDPEELGDNAPRCPKCGYTHLDAVINYGHHPCDGTIPDCEHEFIWPCENVMQCVHCAGLKRA